MNTKNMALFATSFIAIICLFHCRAASPAGTVITPDFTLAAGETLRLAVDYGTGGIMKNDLNYQVLFRLQKSGTASILVTDASRLGGGMIKGTCTSFKGKENMGHKGIQVLYQHSEKVSLPQGTDRVLLGGLTFMHIEE